MTDLQLILLFLLLLMLLAMIGMIISNKYQRKNNNSSIESLTAYLKDNIENEYYPIEVQRISYHNGNIFLKMSNYDNNYTGLLIKKQRYTDLYVLKDDVDLYLSPQNQVK